MSAACRSRAVTLACVLCACSADPGTAARHGSGNAAGSSGQAAQKDSGSSLWDAGAYGNGNAPPASGDASAANGDGSRACASVSVQAKRDVHPGNMLVLFDQSLSMGDAWTDASGNAAPKYVVAGAALETAMQPIAAQLNAGAIFLPTTAAAVTDFPGLCSAAVAPITMAPQIPISSGATFLPLWTQHFAGASPLLLGTPLNKALEEADAALSGTLTGSTVVVIFTDGQWTCEDNSEATSVAALFSRGIKTYVVGLPGAVGVTGLDQLAQLGGTAAAGCSSNCFLLPTDAKKLEDALSMIAQQAVGFDTCSFSINGKILDPQRACQNGTVLIGSMPVACDAKNGFAVDDATHISFHGSACDQLKSSAGSLSATFPCNVIVPQ